MRDAGIPHAEMVERFRVMFVVHRAEIDYVRPAMVDDVLVVETETIDVGGASVVLRQVVRGPNGICASLRVKLACVAIGGNRPARIPPRWRDAIAVLRGETAATADGATETGG